MLSFAWSPQVLLVTNFAGALEGVLACLAPWYNVWVRGGPPPRWRDTKSTHTVCEHHLFCFWSK